MTRELVLTDCTLLDGTGAGAQPGSAVWIGADGTIRAAGPAAAVAAQAGPARVVGLGGATVLAGLINMHVHLGLALPGDMQDAQRAGTDADLALAMAGSARATLHAGVTTVRLVGESRYLDFALRRAIDSGAVDGPRIRTAGHALCCTGGHGWDSDAAEADGADGFRRAVREQLRAGADLIKVCISGGIAGEHEAIDTPQLTDDELLAVIETAHAWGRKVTAHAGPDGATRRAVELGLDCVEHGYELSAGLTDEMARRDVWFVPTIVVSRCADYFDACGVPAWLKERALAAGPRHWQSLRNAIASGVTIALGTDMPPHAGYDGTTATVRELEFMVEAGMSAAAAVESATRLPALWLGLADQIGTISDGKRADLVIVDGDPSTDISALRTLHAVVKDGVVYRDDRGLLR